MSLRLGKTGTVRIFEALGLLDTPMIHYLESLGYYLGLVYISSPSRLSVSRAF